MPMSTCVACGSIISTSAEACPKCGTDSPHAPIVVTRECAECHAEFDGVDQNSCPECGCPCLRFDGVYSDGHIHFRFFPNGTVLRSSCRSKFIAERMVLDADDYWGQFTLNGATMTIPFAPEDNCGTLETTTICTGSITKESIQMRFLYKTKFFKTGTSQKTGNPTSNAENTQDRRLEFREIEFRG